MAGISREGDAGTFASSNIMNNRKLIFAICVVLVPLAACSKDPQAAAREHLEKGEHLRAQNNVSGAIIEYRRAVQEDPRLGTARLRLGDAYAQTGDSANALREYARAAELLPEDNDAQLKAGRYMLLAGQYADARATGERLLAREPNSVEAQVLIANSIAGLKDFETAIDAFEKAAQIDPTRSSTYSEMGAVQMAKGDLTAAEAAFRKAVEKDPKSPLALVNLAHFLWSRGDVVECEKLLKRAIEADPKHPLANRSIAVFYLTRNQVADAEPYLKTAAEVTSNPDSKYALADYYLRLRRLDDARAVVTPLTQNEATYIDASVRLAQIEAADDKKKEAHRILDGVLARDPRNIYALLLRGQIFLSEDNTANALTVLQTAVEGNPNAIAAHISLAQTYARRGSLKEAMNAFNDALKIDGTNSVARLGLAKLHLATGNAGDAVPLLLKVVEANPTLLEPQLMLLQGLIAVNDVPQATMLAANLVKTHGDSAAVQTAVGQLATLKKDDEAARLAYNRALAADPRSYQALAGLLNAEMHSKNFGSARALIEKQLAQNPNDPNLNMMAAQAYGAIGDSAEMEKALRKTLEADPHRLEAYAMLGKMYYQMGRLDLARSELEKYVATAPASVPGNTMLGTILDLQGKTQEAKARYNRALQIDPRAAVAANNIAWIDANSDGANLDVALQLAQTAKSQLPNQHEVDDTLGWIYYKKGLTSRAIDALETSALKSPNSPTYAYHLGLAYAKNGDSAKARKELERALRLRPDFDGADDAKKVLESLK
jgi:putative PEP-CTERM system TPR-repeat lipoprotein